MTPPQEAGKSKEQIAAQKFIDDNIGAFYDDQAEGVAFNAFIAGTEYAQSREQPWVRVTDRLPEIPKQYYDKEYDCMVTPCEIKVLVYDCIEDAVFEKFYGILPWDKDITHWRKLPSAPPIK